MWFGRITKHLVLCSLVLVMLSVSVFGCQQGTQKSSKTDTEKNEAVEPKEKEEKSKYASSQSPAAKEKQGKITFKVGIDPFDGAEKVRVWLPYPVTNEHQDVTDVKIDGNFADSGVYREGKFGNTILYAEWDQPDSKPEISFSFKVRRSEIIRKDFSENEDVSVPPEVEEFLTASSRGSTDGTCKKTAEKITDGKKSSTAKAEAVYDYIVENFARDDAIVGCGLGNVKDLLDSKKGKCTDIHSVFVAMARSVGVPAREVFGIRMPSKDETDMTKSYHCRSEFYVLGYGWVPVDASDVLKLMLKENLKLEDEKVKEARNYFFGSQNETYVDFGIGRDLVLNPEQQGDKLNYFMYPYAEVDGKPIDFLSQEQLKYTVTFEKL